MVRPKYYDKEMAGLTDQTGKVFAITGTTTGTGNCLARAVLSKGGSVVMLNRASSRSAAALASMKEAFPEGKVEQFDCDLQSFDSVKAAAAKVAESHSAIDVLVLNAGIMAMADKRTADGFDVQMQTNVLSHFLLAKELYPQLEAAAEARGEARVVNHSSLARISPKKTLKAKYFEKSEAGGLGGDGSGLMMNGAKWARYQQTKLACLVFATALGDKLAAKDSKVMSVCAHPGFSSTSLQTTSTGMPGCGNSLIMKLAQHGDDGALGIMHCAMGADVKNKDFYGPKNMMGVKGPVHKIKLTKLDDSPAVKTNFWDFCSKAVGEFAV